MWEFKRFLYTFFKKKYLKYRKLLYAISLLKLLSILESHNSHDKNLMRKMYWGIIFSFDKLMDFTNI